MLRKTIVLLVFFIGSVFTVCIQTANNQETTKELEEQEDAIHITEPKDGDLVDYRYYVEGTVADPDAEVWVIVHPMEVSDYWVQPSLKPKEDGTWKVCAFFGSGPGSDIGKLFEIMAVANPNEKLYEGKVLHYWPESQWQSQIVEVERK